MQLNRMLRRKGIVHFINPVTNMLDVEYKDKNKTRKKFLEQVRQQLLSRPAFGDSRPVALIPATHNGPASRNKGKILARIKRRLENPSLGLTRKQFKRTRELLK